MHTPRVATIEDLDVVAELLDAYRGFYEQPPNPDLAKRFIRDRIRNNESVIVLAVGETGRANGFCQLYPSFCSIEAKPIYVLYDLFVMPEARRSGAAKVLLRAAEQIAAEHGMARMDLTTARTNLPAQALYEAMGWVRDEVFYTYSKRIEDPCS